jgi:hypothetical protein
MEVKMKYKVRINENFKIGVMSLSDIIGVEKNFDLINGQEIEIEKEIFETLLENYKQALTILEEDEND